MFMMASVRLCWPYTCISYRSLSADLICAFQISQLSASVWGATDKEWHIRSLSQAFHHVGIPYPLADLIAQCVGICDISFPPHIHYLSRLIVFFWLSMTVQASCVRVLLLHTHMRWSYISCPLTCISYRSVSADFICAFQICQCVG